MSLRCATAFLFSFGLQIQAKLDLLASSNKKSRPWAGIIIYIPL
jgi:hypothetical protein